MWQICGVGLVLAGLAYVVIRHWVNSAPYGIELPGVGFVETDENGKPKHVRDL